jgi:hypothetical protein
MTESKSLVEIYRKSRPFISSDPANIFLPIVIALSSFIFDLSFGPMQRQDFLNLLSVMISLNGAILGFAIAGFGVSQFFSNSSLLVLLATKKSDNCPWSHFKTYLLIWLNVLTLILFASFILSTIYFLASYSHGLKGAALCASDHLASFFKLEISGSTTWRLLKAITVAISSYFELIVFIKVKVFIFYLYDNSLLMGQAAAVDAGKKPYDNGNC